MEERIYTVHYTAREMLEKYLSGWNFRYRIYSSGKDDGYYTVVVWCNEEDSQDIEDYMDANFI